MGTASGLSSRFPAQGNQSKIAKGVLVPFQICPLAFSTTDIARNAMLLFQLFSFGDGLRRFLIQAGFCVEVRNRKAKVLTLAIQCAAPISSVIQLGVRVAIFQENDVLLS